MRDGHLEASGHNWVEGQGAGPRIDKNAGGDDDQYDAMGNKIDTTKTKKITSSEARKVCLRSRHPHETRRLTNFMKLKKERLARKKRGEAVSDDEL